MGQVSGKDEKAKHFFENSQYMENRNSETFGDLYVFFDKKRNQQVIVQELDRDIPLERLNKLKVDDYNPYIISVYSIFQTTGQQWNQQAKVPNSLYEFDDNNERVIFIVMEYWISCLQARINQLIRENRRFTEQDLWSIGRCLVEAAKHMQQICVPHGRISSNNVLFTSHQNNEVKLSLVQSRIQSLNENCDIDHKDEIFKKDSYDIGKTLLQASLLSKQKFHDISHENIIRHLETVSQFYSQQWINFLKQLLKENIHQIPVPIKIQMYQNYQYSTTVLHQNNEKIATQYSKPKVNEQYVPYQTYTRKNYEEPVYERKQYRNSKDNHQGINKITESPSHEKKITPKRSKYLKHFKEGVKSQQMQDYQPYSQRMANNLPVKHEKAYSTISNYSKYSTINQNPGDLIDGRYKVIERYIIDPKTQQRKQMPLNHNRGISMYQTTNNYNLTQEDYNPQYKQKQYYQTHKKSPSSIVRMGKYTESKLFTGPKMTQQVMPKKGHESPLHSPERLRFSQFASPQETKEYRQSNSPSVVKEYRQSHSPSVINEYRKSQRSQQTHSPKYAQQQPTNQVFQVTRSPVTQFRKSYIEQEEHEKNSGNYNNNLLTSPVKLETSPSYHKKTPLSKQTYIIRPKITIIPPKENHSQINRPVETKTYYQSPQNGGHQTQTKYVRYQSPSYYNSPSKRSSIEHQNNQNYNRSSYRTSQNLDEERNHQTYIASQNQANQFLRGKTDMRNNSTAPEHQISQMIDKGIEHIEDIGKHQQISTPLLISRSQQLSAKIKYNMEMEGLQQENQEGIHHDK